MTPARLLIRRSAAYVLDIVVLFAVLAPAGWLVQRAFGLAPSTGREIWLSLLWNFSLPVWTYFAVFDSDLAMGSIGKRTFGLRVVSTASDARVPFPRSLLRTALKLAPWEIVHVSTFALSNDLSNMTPVQMVGLVLGNALTVAYFATAAVTGGRRSVHDLALGTEVCHGTKGGTVPTLTSDTKGAAP